MADRYREALETISALLWATIGAALIGGVGVTLILLFDNAARFLNEPLTVVLMPAGIGAASLIVVLPCTMVFGLPSAALINRLGLGRWPALLLCMLLATATQVACIRLLFWNESSQPADFLFTTPFALGAAVVLWWRLTRLNYP